MVNYATVSASLLIKAMLWRQSSHKTVGKQVSLLDIQQQPSIR